jgi:alpha-glucosidase
MIAFRKASPVLVEGEIALLDAAGPILAFVRRRDGEALACVFNLSDRPQVAELPELNGGTLTRTRAGEAELRGASLGLSPHAAVFVRLAA